MTSFRKQALVLFSVVLLAAACGDTGPDGARARPKNSATVATPAEPLEPDDLTAPPPVTVRYGDEAIALHAWTYCYRAGCADGAPPRHPPDVGEPSEIVVEFPIPEWSFAASFTPAGERCGRVQQLPLEPTGEGEFVLRPAGHADTYDVTLTGRGNGDLFVTFRWTTPTDGPLPKPTARLAVLAGNDGAVDSYGVELELTNLAETPGRALATITVQASNGDALTFDARPSGTECLPEGSLYWDGPDDKGIEATRLGDGPFTYKVELLLDGDRYVATATWPNDEIAGNEPSVALDFNPPLPALS